MLHIKIIRTFFLQTCGFKVNTNSPEWHKSMNKILKKIKGLFFDINIKLIVYRLRRLNIIFSDSGYNMVLGGNFWIDVDEGMAYVTGQGDPNKLLKLMGSKRGKDAEMAFVKTSTNHHDHHNFYNNYQQNSYFGGQSTPYWPSDMSYLPSPSPGYYSPATAMQPYHQQYPYPGGYNNYGYY